MAPLNDWEGGGCELDSGYTMDASLMVSAMQVREAQAIGGGDCACKGEETKYGTLGADPLVL